MQAPGFAAPSGARPSDAPTPQTPHQHWSVEVGGSLDYLILRELRFWLGRRGGVNHEGRHWVYKSAQELATFFGRARNTVSAALRRLVAQGLLVREQLGVKVGHHCNRSYYYRLGDDAPAWLVSQGNAAHNPGAVHCATPAQTNNSSTSTKHFNGKRPANQQPAATPQNGKRRSSRALEQLQQLIAPLKATGEAPRRLYSDLQAEEWARNPVNPANRARGFGYG